MRWQRNARFAVAAIGLGCAAAVYFYTRDRPTQEIPLDAVRKHPTAKSETGRGSYMRSKGGKELWEITYAGLREYPDGRMHFEGARLKDKVEDFEMSADVVDTAPRPAGSDTPGELVATGHVHVLTKDGATLDADTATYDERIGLIKIPGAVMFSRGRMSGQGLGATFDRVNNILNVFDQTRVVVTPDEAGLGAITATSKTLLFARNEKSARFVQDARIVRDTETLSGDTAILVFTDDEQQLKSLELRGRGAVTPAPTAESAGPPEMHADDITLLMYPDGRAVSQARLEGHASMLMTNAEGARSIVAPRIGLSLAPDGKTLTRLNAKDGVVVELPATKATPAARRITAMTLDAQGNDKQGLTAARFDDRVVFTETRQGGRGQKPTERTGRSRVLLLALKGQLDAIDQAEFRDSVTFVDGEVKGTADVAVYRTVNGDLQLRQADGSPRAAHVENGTSLIVDARAVDVNVTTQDLDARGTVRTDMRQAASASSGRSSALFEKDKPVNGVSAELHYTKESGEARFVGSTAELARLRQEQNTVDGIEIVIWEKTQNLKATGSVDSRFLLADTPQGRGAAKTQTYRVTSDALDYNDAARTATYVADKSKPDARARLESTEGQTSARTIVLTLASVGRSVEKITARDAVDATLEGGRRAWGDLLIYDAPTEDYTLMGKPAIAILPSADGVGCEKHTGQKFIFNRKTRSVRSTQGQTEKVDCAK